VPALFASIIAATTYVTKKTNITCINDGKSVASFCRQVVALVPDKFFNFYLEKNHKFANKLVTTEAREKISTFWNP
jgi:hypothetical protein